MSGPGPLASDGTRAPRQVLYIEDEPLNVVLMQETFRHQPGWLLLVARDGEEGIALARQCRPDLVMIDLHLPDMSGHQVLAGLRADPVTAGLVCVALSGDTLPEQMRAAKQAGFVDYWTKPMDLLGLMAAIARLLDNPGRP